MTGHTDWALILPPLADGLTATSGWVPTATPAISFQMHWTYTSKQTIQKSEGTRGIGRMHVPDWSNFWPIEAVVEPKVNPRVPWGVKVCNKAVWEPDNWAAVIKYQPINPYKCHTNQNGEEEDWEALPWKFAWIAAKSKADACVLFWAKAYEAAPIKARAEYFILTCFLIYYSLIDQLFVSF